MSELGQYLQVGDEALTDYIGFMTRVVIVQRIENTGSQTGVCFRARSARFTTDRFDDQAVLDSWWFEPVPNQPTGPSA